MKAKHILFISSQDLWGEGSAPQRSPGRTVKGYIDAGYTVSIISTQLRNLKYRKISSEGSIIVPFSTRGIKRLPQVIKILIWSICFPIVAVIAGLLLNFNKRVDAIYGYEVQGVLAGWVLRLFLRRPLISRFQGVIWYRLIEKKSLIRRLIYLDHFIAYFVKPNLTIMTNDGTDGESVLERIRGSLTLVKFWRNGVNNPDVLISGELRRSLGISEDRKIILTVCRLVRWKGVHKAIELINASMYQDRSVLVIVGDGPEMRNLRKMVEQYGLEQNVFFIGEIPQTEVLRVMSQADIFLSLYEMSNVGNPLLEALRCGLAIITIDEGETRALIRNGFNGVLLDKWDLNEALIPLDSMLEDQKMLYRLSRNASEYAEKELWDWPARIKTEIDEVAKLL